MQDTFYWHDYETFGVNPAVDRPSQFAGLRTDFDLNPIGEPLVIYCQPQLDILPAPQACLVTGITPQLALEKGLPEPQFIQAIHQQLSQPKTCGVGYNSIRFDDEVSRYTLYRNFYDPYQREWKNGNSRWDVIDMMRLTRALRPEGIEWPDHEPGRPSFKLEDLTAANGRTPGFTVLAARDPNGANLDRIQIVKGWLNSRGEPQEQVFDVALSPGREQNPDGSWPAVSSTVDSDNATYSNSIGAAQLSAFWQDPDFNPEQRAFYYARVLEIPTPRHSLYDFVALQKQHPDSRPETIQERAYSSPIWYTPAR